jgi:hypothetical protein
MNSFDELPSGTSPVNPTQRGELLASAPDREAVSPRFAMPPLLWGSAGLTAACRPRAWLWHGYLAPGAVTLLTSQWKAGKTTLASVLLARLKTGGQLAGLPVAAGRAIVVSEEGPDLWQRRHQQLGFGDHVGWFCRPFRGKPRRHDWSAFVDGLAGLHDRLAYSLVVIDPLAAFLPGNENHAGSVLEALLPLQRLTARDLSVFVMHHPRKGDPPVGQAARGSGALSGYADIVIEMRFYPRAADDDRRRRLWACSRYPETPRQLVIEWTADGTDYVARGTFSEEEFVRHWESLRAVLAEAPLKLTRADIRRRWPGAQPPDKVSLSRWLERAVEQGLVMKDGRGLRNHPFRYWLPEREAAWRQDPLACLHMPELLDP